MPTPHQPPQNIDELLRIIAARDSEVALLKLMVDKLKLQLLRRVRSEFGTGSLRIRYLQRTVVGADAFDRWWRDRDGHSSQGRICTGPRQ